MITLPVTEGEPLVDARLMSPLYDSSQSMDKDCIHTWRIPDMDRVALGGKTSISTADPWDCKAAGRAAPGEHGAFFCAGRKEVLGC